MRATMSVASRTRTTSSSTIPMGAGRYQRTAAVPLGSGRWLRAQRAQQLAEAGLHAAGEVLGEVPAVLVDQVAVLEDLAVRGPADHVGRRHRLDGREVRGHLVLDRPEG